VGNHITQSCDTVLGVCNSFGYDEFNRLTARTVTQGTVQNFTYTYDRYGNRWAQNAPQGGPVLSISFNTGNNIINTAGFANDIPGNIASDGLHNYGYDADGNLISVDSGQTATYYYDSLNQRVRIAPTRGTYEFVWDLMGQRVSNWAASSHSFVESNAYTDSGPIAIRSGGQTQFEHQNWLGTERLRTSYNGAVALSIDSLPWADGHTPSGDNGDQHDFALMDRDLEDNTEHAQYRQYSTNLGRWQSPDLYDGSYDFTNPQSFNRYSYASNDPVNYLDPSGLDGVSPTAGVGAVGGCIGAAASEGTDYIADIGCGWSLFKGIESLFSGPSFHGTLKPRPTNTAGWDGNFGESLGIPTTVPPGNLGLGMALGLPSQGCEFGACGAGPMGVTDNPPGVPSNITISIPPAAWYWATHGSHSPVSHSLWWHGNWCGVGGSGLPTDDADASCLIHDYCYFAIGVTAGNNWLGAPVGKTGAIRGCNQQLCDNEFFSGGTVPSASVQLFFTFYAVTGGRYGCSGKGPGW
jgi:RHS repeat-associated protein